MIDSGTGTRCMRIRPGGAPDLSSFDLGDRELLVTRPSGKAHTHGADEGRTGWKRHAVKDGVAACGLRPKDGWGADLFEDDMDICSRCAVKLGACKTCRGSGRLSEEVQPRRWEGKTCHDCSGSGAVESSHDT